MSCAPPFCVSTSASVLVALFTMLFAPSPSLGNPAWLWFSLSETDPYKVFAEGPQLGYPEAVSLSISPGSTSTIYLWGQPQTVEVNRSYDAVENPFWRLVGLSLNFVAYGHGVRIDEVVLNNPSGLRFDEVIDSANPIVAYDQSGEPITHPRISDSDILGVAAYAFFDPPIDPDSGAGIGPDCDSSPLGCVDGELGPAWLLGSATLSGVEEGGFAGIQLQVGSAGIAHAEEFTEEGVFPQTEVVFGPFGAPRYNALRDRNATFGFDSPAAHVTVDEPAPVLPGDFSRDGRIDAVDYTVWRDGLGGAYAPSDYAVWRTAYGDGLGDYNADGSVDAADYTVWRDTLGKVGVGLAADGDGSRHVDAGDYSVWRSRYGAPRFGGADPQSPATQTPEPIGLLAIGLVLATLSINGRCARRASSMLTYAVFVTFAIAPVEAYAQSSNTWIGPANATGDWNFDDNWSLGHAPQPGENVSISIGAPDQTAARLDTPSEIGELDVALYGSGTLLIDAGGSLTSGYSTIGFHPGSSGAVQVSADTVTGREATWSITSGQIDVGVSGSGRLTVASGGSVSGVSRIGVFGGSSGMVTVTGDQSDIVASGLSVGHEGTASLRIEASGAVTAPASVAIGERAGSFGAATVTGFGSTLSIGGDARVGDEGVGILRVEAGGTAHNSYAYVGNAPGALGEVIVTGSGSEWINEYDVFIGVGGGSGTLNFAQGASVSNRYAVLGLGSGVGEAVISSGATWNTQGILAVGSSSSGSLRIQSGATVSSTIGEIGRFSGLGGFGVAIVQGANSSWDNSNGLNVRDGQLVLEEGALVTSLGSGLRIESQGSVTVKDGSVIRTEGASVFGSVVLAHSGETTPRIEIVPGSFSEETFQLNSGGSLTGSGTIAGHLITSGFIAPGNSPGTITIEGDLTQNATSQLEIEVGGLTPGTQHDQVIVTGTATLGGTYTFPIIDGFVPQLGQEIAFLTAGAITPGSQPTAAFVPGLFQANPDLAFTVVSSPTDVRLRFVAPLENSFDDPTNTDADWFTASGWDLDRAPVATDNTFLLGSSTGDPQRVTVNTPDPVSGSSTATVRSLSVEGVLSQVTVGVDSGFTLAATVGDVTIGSGGTIELDGGVLAVAGTQAVRVTGAGALAGAGSVTGSVEVGVEMGSHGAMLSPGVDGSPAMQVGLLSIAGGYTQGAAGMMSIDVAGDASGGAHDTVHVTGPVSLGGVLEIDVAELEDAEFTPGAPYDLVLASTLDGTFDRIEVVGRDDIYFAVNYGAASGGEGADALAATAAPLIVEATGYYRGDATQDGAIDERDARVLAAVLVSNSVLRVPCGDGCEAAANFLDAFDFIDTTHDDLRVVDFYDVPYFARALARSQAMPLPEAYAVIEAAIAVARVPEPGAALLAAAAIAMIVGRVRW